MKPTDSELEIMQVLWSDGPLTVREVNEVLNETRRVGYTTTLKMMQIMTDKGLLSRNTSQRSHIYAPAVKPEEIRSGILDHIVRTAFQGSTSKLVLHALGNRGTTREEMEEIRELIEKLEKQQDGTV